MFPSFLNKLLFFSDRMYKIIRNDQPKFNILNSDLLTLIGQSLSPLLLSYMLSLLLSP